MFLGVVMLPPDLTNILMSLKSVLIPIVAIGSIKLIVWACYWNYKKLNGFVKKDYKYRGMTRQASIVHDIIKAQRARVAKHRHALAEPKTDSSNWTAIITNPFGSLWSFIKGLFK